MRALRDFSAGAAPSVCEGGSFRPGRRTVAQACRSEAFRNYTGVQVLLWPTFRSVLVALFLGPSDF